MVGQQRQQISELQFDKFLAPSSFLSWEIRFRNQVTTCSDFLSEALLWIKEVEMVDPMEELKSSRSVAGKNFPNFEMLDAKIASALNKMIPVSVRKTDRLHDLRLLSSDWRSWYSIRLCWFILCHLHDDNIQEFETIWDEVLLSVSKIPSDDILESLYKVGTRESTQLKTVL